MQLLLERIDRLRIGWNERPLSQLDADELCRRLSVSLDERPLTVDGFYYRLFDRDFIAVNSRLPPHKKLLVVFHELAHCMFHAPVSGPAAGFHHVGRSTRKEREADIFALCAMVPKPWLKNRTLAELLDDGFSRELIDARAAVLERYGL